MISLFIVGTHLFRKYQFQKRVEASNIYQSMLAAVQNENLDKVKALGIQLENCYKETPYAQLSALILAKIAVDEGNIQAAIVELRQVFCTCGQTLLSHVAKIRLARLLHAIGDNKTALKELEGSKNGYEALYEEVKGDIYLTLNQEDKAKKAYQNAVSISQGVNKLPWLQLKLLDLSMREEKIA